MKLGLFLISAVSTASVTVSAFVAPQISARRPSSIFMSEDENEDENMGAQSISGLTSGLETIFTSEDIDKILPHRYPFALVDKVVEYTPGKSAVGIKTVTKNEPHFNGHFPDKPIMPGVLQVEALAQLAGIVALKMEGAEPGALFFFAGVDGVRWKRPVVPGDVLVMEVEMLRMRRGICKASGTAYVDGEVAVVVESM